MRRIVWIALMVGGGVVAARDVAAQEGVRFRAEGRLKFAVPEGLWNENNDIRNGRGIGVNGQVWLAPWFGIYGGWEWARFNMDRPDLVHTVHAYASETGYRGGVITPYTLGGTGRIIPYIFIGGLFNWTSFGIRDSREFFGVTSNGDLGSELGAGLSVPIGTVSMLTPSFSYRTHRATFGPPEPGIINETTVAYLSFDLGLRVNLGR